MINRRRPNALRRSLLLTVVLSLVPGGLLAAPKAPNARAQRFDRIAKSAYTQKDYAEAIVAFEAAYQADPMPRFLYNIGRCHEKAGNLARAADTMRQFLAIAKDEEDRRDARDRLDIVLLKLGKSHGRVRIGASPGGATVRFEKGEDVMEGHAPYDQWMPAGEWSLSITAPDHLAHKELVKIRKGKTNQMTVKLEKEAEVLPVAAIAAPPPQPEPEPTAATAPPPREPIAAADADADDGGAGWITWAALGTGGALLASGVVFGIVSHGLVSDLEDMKSSDSGVQKGRVDATDAYARRYALAANILLVTGGVAALTGVALLATGFGETGDPVAEAPVSLVPLVGGAALTWRGQL
jgi:tetratricopeptide (TPR) repeat protein